MTINRSVNLLLCVLLWQGIPASVGMAEIRGDSDSVAAANNLLEQVGGAAAWRAPVFEVRERIYLKSGEVAEVRIVRDLAKYVRLLESTRPGRHITEWLSPDGGWVRRNEDFTAMSPEELAAELQGLRQEPYAIYHRLAHGDPRLRVEKRDDGRLLFFDADERLLCWFEVAPNGVVLSWGNFYDGAINQHYYGPAFSLGEARLPRFGISSTGSIRFEYLGARFADQLLVEPGRPAPKKRRPEGRRKLGAESFSSRS